MLLHASRRAAARAAPAARRGAQRLQTRPPSGPDYFALTECERRFDLDLTALHERYKSFMVQIHPDKLARRPADEQQELASRAATLTQAVGVLRDPAQRAKHLLELHGRPLGEEATGESVGAPFLAQMLDAREAVEEAKSEAELHRLDRDNDALVQTLSAALAGAFARRDLDEASRLTAQLQYLQRIGAEIRQRRE
ncbi:hypothetical protein KFE25_014386 [Diacronema lutheri]|uniref:Co-chaperone HscB C-terminal oligomerisation domain-containing protein n=1 Tax=Diacronema lutheri TaxID=2081491 RepID=A0A8J5XAG2_DIALT|nr:hypothetical protein KFE25_014386 [Diacronema lutheri]